jgi:transaldolase
MAKNVGTVIVEFAQAVVELTAASARLTVTLPFAIKQAIADAKESAAVEAQLDAALIDPTLIDRMTAGK